MKEFINECQEHVKNIAEELEMYADNAYICPRCGAVHTMDEYEIREYDDIEDRIGYICPECGDERTENELENVGIWDYFNDCFDIEYRIGSDRQYRSVCVMVACGGPNIYVDTGSKKVELYWGNVQETHPLTAYTVAAIDDYFSEMFECC